MKFWRQLLFLMLFVFAGVMLCLLPVVVIMFATRNPFSPLVLHATQWAQVLIAFILPAMLWGKFLLRPNAELMPWRFRNNSWSDVTRAYGFRNPGWRALLWAALLVVVSLPLMDALTVSCYNLPYPDDIRNMITDQAHDYYSQITLVVGDNSVGAIIEAFLLICLMAGLSEEILFRGALQSLFRTETRLNIHWIALLIGIIFSLIHFDLSGFVPRMVMGMAFSYMVHYTGSIWPGILAHTLNNTISLVGLKMSEQEDVATLVESMSEYTFSWPWVAASALVTAGFWWVLVKKSAFFAKR